jgi:hypothetical protein
MTTLVPVHLEVGEWGPLRILRALPRIEDAWGCLAVLRGTYWEKVFCVVPGEVFSHALHGHFWPFLKLLGREPEVLCRLLPKEAVCARFQDKSCPLRDAKKCRPGTELPTCYQIAGLSSEAALVAYEVARGLSEGFYIVITKGKTFSL